MPEIVDSIHFSRDGDQWCATWDSFVDLQNSPAGFGDTKYRAVIRLFEESQMI